MRPLVISNQKDDLYFFLIQAERVQQYTDRTKGHRTAGNDRIQKAHCGKGNPDHVV